MERIVVDQSGAVVIPPEIVQVRGVSPGDELNLVETEQGWLVSLEANQEYRSPLWEEWWNGLTEEERESAREEARQYWALTEEERDAIWDEGDEDLAWIDEEDDDDEEDEDEDGGKELEGNKEQRFTQNGAS